MLEICAAEAKKSGMLVKASTSLGASFPTMQWIKITVRPCLSLKYKLLSDPTSPFNADSAQILKGEVKAGITRF